MTRYSTNLAFVGSLFLVISALPSEAQVITRIGSGVQAMFASQSDAYRDSDPTGITWGLPPGPGLYPAGFVISGLPAAPSPGITTAPGNAFANGGYTSLFADNFAGSSSGTQAQATIDDSVAVLPTFTSDVQVLFPNWRLAQGPTAPGYAYNQLNFGSNYLFTANPGLAPVVNPAIPLLLVGNTQGLTAYAQFDALLNYNWTPVTLNTAGTITGSGPTSSLGSLNYSWSTIGAGPIFLTLNSSGSLLATPAGNGVLSITGHGWVAGDPFDLTVSSVPEPTSLMLVGVGLALSAYRRRRRALPIAA